MIKMIIKKPKGYNYDPNTYNGKFLVHPKLTKKKIEEILTGT
jgi:hypothetical protein